MKIIKVKLVTVYLRAQWDSIDSHRLDFGKATLTIDEYGVLITDTGHGAISSFVPIANIHYIVYSPLD